MGKFRYCPAAAVVAACLLPFSRPLHGALSLASGVALRVLERVTPELTDPPVRFRVAETAGEDPFALAEGPGLDGAAGWQVQVFDSSGNKVAYVQGAGRPGAAAIAWSGTAPDGTPLPDGFYEARLVWFDSARRAYATERQTLSLATPLEIRSLAGRGLKFGYTDEGLVITLQEKLVFRPGASELQKEALPALDEVRLFLADHPDNRINVRGYTDSSGPPEANLKLSRERAARVCAYLAAGGIPAARLAFSGLGAAAPVAPNDTPAGRARNRRVDIVMLKS